MKAKLSLEELEGKNAMHKVTQGLLREYGTAAPIWMKFNVDGQDWLTCLTLL